MIPVPSDHEPLAHCSPATPTSSSYESTVENTEGRAYTPLDFLPNIPHALLGINLQLPPALTQIKLNRGKLLFVHVDVLGKGFARKGFEMGAFGGWFGAAGAEAGAVETQDGFLEAAEAGGAEGGWHLDVMGKGYETIGDGTFCLVDVILRESCLVAWKVKLKRDESFQILSPRQNEVGVE